MSSYDLTTAAENDLHDIWDYTFETWGAAQADKYLDQLDSCCEQIGTGQMRYKTFEELPDNIRVGRCQHHYIFWLDGPKLIVIAMLHERMDMVRQLAARV